MLITDNEITKHSDKLLLSFFKAKDVFIASLEMSNRSATDLHGSVMALIVKGNYEKYVIRYTHMKIIENEFKSSINNHRWN